MFIIFGVCISVPFGIAILLVTGKIGGDAISGFNTMSKEKREKYDEKSLSRFVGWLLIVFCLGLFLIPTGKYLKIGWLTFFGGVFAFVVLFVGVIYANTGKRFYKDKKCTKF